MHRRSFFKRIGIVLAASGIPVSVKANRLPHVCPQCGPDTATWPVWRNIDGVKRYPATRYACGTCHGEWC